MVTAARKSALVIPLEFPQVLTLPPALIQQLGPGNALAFMQLIMEQALRQMLPVDDDYRAFIMFRPRERTRDVQEWLAWARGRATLEWNEGETRPQRLAHALRYAFDDGAERVILVEPTCLELKRSRVAELFDALTSNDVLIGPTPERDIYAIATRHPLTADLLEVTGHVDGCKPVALAEALAARGLEVQMLDDARTVRHPDDLAALPPQVRTTLPTKFRHGLALLGLE
jgi:glycosyltransferase A (GT-A) superfamily protein (DUF2064 family)